MNGNTHGMNVEEVQQLGRFLQRDAVEQVVRISDGLDRQVSRTSWVGPEGTRFRTEWWPEKRRQLRRISDELSQFGDQAITNAKEQLMASQDVGGVVRAIAEDMLSMFRSDARVDLLFSERMQSHEPGPEILTMARLAGEQPPQGWTRLSDDQLRSMGLDPSMFRNGSGFEACLYQSDDGTVVLNFHGSDLRPDGDSLGDWQNNLSQYFGGDSDQYRQAVDLARDVKEVYGGQLVITGHSLGGGLASIAAVATDTHAITFNSAAVNDRMLREVGLDPGSARSEADGLVGAYHLEGEILHSVQAPADALGGPKVMGTTYSVDNPNAVRNTIAGVLAPSSLLSNGVADHLMPSVISGLENDERFR